MRRLSPWFASSCPNQSEDTAMTFCRCSLRTHKENMVEGVTDVVYLGETMPGDAKAYLKKRIEEELHLKTEEYIISPIVGVCCGPGMYGCWFKGKLVTEKGAKK